ncbi:MAG: bifunctional 4-hydroxy-2-oxoglutarate aldolase/2-dehydro-3-deoxy-phosphogluconate aldolase [Clostridia bacterium]|nr:bifunctional 4-hydroxy-2-oxoglutarate aldolase/2-dehydro-3-deoxy-phosphogluconate aldolase [Clostridia bacterium]
MPQNDPKFTAKYDKLIRELELCGFVPLITINNFKNASPLAGALTTSNIRALEITFRTNQAPQVIKLLNTKYKNLIVGAGTVINTAQVDLAIESGAQYIITPSFNEEVVDRCIERNIPIFPGCSNATDIEHAYAKGLRVVKYFPAELSGGVEMLKALSGPYPFMKFIPTGGINCSNIGKYLAFNKVLFCAGTFIASEENIKNGNFEEIVKNAKAAVNAITDLKFERIELNTNYFETSNMFKTLSSFFGDLYQKGDDDVSIFKKYADNLSADNKGFVVYSTPNIERTLYYLEYRGFIANEKTIVRNSKNIQELCFNNELATGYGLKLVRRDNE